MTTSRAASRISSSSNESPSSPSSSSSSTAVTSVASGGAARPATRLGPPELDHARGLVLGDVGAVDAVGLGLARPAGRACRRCRAGSRRRSCRGWCASRSCEATWKAMREGKFALITPVMTSTDGRCVASTRWMPTARAICASRAIGSSISCGRGEHEVGQLVDHHDQVGELLGRHLLVAALVELGGHQPGRDLLVVAVDVPRPALGQELVALLHLAHRPAQRRGSPSWPRSSTGRTRCGMPL